MTKKQYKNQNILRPYLVEGRSIDSIIFYANGKELFYIQSGWIENERHDITSIYINEVAVARKENLNRKDNFILKCRNPRKDWKREDEYILYINAETEGLTISDVDKKFYYENDTEKTYKLSRTIKGLRHTEQQYNPDSKEWYTQESTGDIKHIFAHEDELKPFGEKIKLASEILSSEDKRVSKYEMEKIYNAYKKVEHIFKEVA